MTELVNGTNKEPKQAWRYSRIIMVLKKYEAYMPKEALYEELTISHRQLGRAMRFLVSKGFIREGWFNGFQEFKYVKSPRWMKKRDPPPRPEPLHRQPSWPEQVRISLCDALYEHREPAIIETIHTLASNTDDGIITKSAVSYRLRTQHNIFLRKNGNSANLMDWAYIMPRLVESGIAEPSGKFNIKVL